MKPRIALGQYRIWNVTAPDGWGMGYTVEQAWANYLRRKGVHHAA